MRIFRPSRFAAASLIPTLAALVVLLATPAFALTKNTDTDSGVESYTLHKGMMIPTTVTPPEPGTSCVKDVRKGTTGGPLRPLSNMPLMTGKLWRGFNNTFLGWVEVPKRVLTDVAMMDPFTGFVTGVTVGSAKAIQRTGIGMIEVLTFWHEWPEGYAPVITPEYVLEDFND